VLTEHGCKIAPRTFYAWLARPPSARTLWDTVTLLCSKYYLVQGCPRHKSDDLDQHHRPHVAQRMAVRLT